MMIMVIGQENLRKMVDEEINKIIKQSGLLIKLREISDEEAGKEIEEFILRAKISGKTNISVFDVVAALVLPPEQVEKILESFEQSGRVSEFNE